MKTNLTLLGLAALALTASPAEAQSNRQGTAGADYLLVPATAKTSSLGISMTAGSMSTSGVEMLQVNPAGLTLNPSTDVLFSRMNYVADIGVNYLGVAQRLGNNQVGLSLQNWDFGDIPRQSEESPEINEGVDYNAQIFVAGLSFARQFTDRISAGTTFKVMSESIDNVSAQGIAFDAGMTYAAGESGLRFGVSLKNIGPQMSYGGNGLVRFEQLSDQNNNAQPVPLIVEGAPYELPSLLNFGVTYQRDLGNQLSATTMANFRSNSFAGPQYAGGLELGFRNLFYVRGGYQYEEGVGKETFFQGYNLGAGLNLNLNGTRLMVDYAYRPVEYLGNGVQMFTLSAQL